VQFCHCLVHVFEVLQRVDQELPVREFRIFRNFIHAENIARRPVIYAGGMTTDTVGVRDPSGDPRGDSGEGAPWGRAMDAAGALAAVVIVAILVDIWTDGRLISRHLPGRRQPPPPPEGTPDE
jgi:hypothetical protein